MYRVEPNNIYNMDCLEGMKLIGDASVDMILCDLPYGTTSCAWDAVIPFEPLWEQYRRIIKPNGATVLTAAQPFTTDLINSNRDHFRYLWYWSKNLPSGVGLAKYQPMRVVEDIVVFYASNPTYNKQPTLSLISDRKLVEGAKNGSGSNGSHHIQMKSIPNVMKPNVNPRNLLEFKCVSNAGGHKLHPTQKPVALFEYLIRTYTNPGELVFDNCMGSGTTAIACMNTDRRYIGFETDAGYYTGAIKRIENHTAPINIVPFLGAVPSASLDALF